MGLVQEDEETLETQKHQEKDQSFGAGFLNISNRKQTREKCDFKVVHGLYFLEGNQASQIQVNRRRKRLWEC